MTLAEGTGFEPAGVCAPSVFQTDCLASSHPSVKAIPGSMVGGAGLGGGSGDRTRDGG